jgi:hypothetical protein
VDRASGTIVLIHALFGALAWALFHFLAPPLLGQALAASVALYTVVLPAWAWLRSQHELFEAWTFLLPLSVALVLPDWILVAQFGVLGFPDLGAPRIGPVPAFMAGLWVPPLVCVLWLAALARRVSGGVSLLFAGAAALAVFGAAEWFAPGLGLWQPHNVRRIEGVALYVLPAEAALGLAAWAVFSAVEGRGVFAKLLGAAFVSVFYCGALVTSYFVVERLLA